MIFVAVVAVSCPHFFTLEICECILVKCFGGVECGIRNTELDFVGDSNYIRK